MSEERTFAEAVRLTDPEQLPPDYISQYSVERLAVEFQSVLGRFTSLRETMRETGVEFGGRVLLIGPPGTDFGAFVRYLCREVPIKIIAFRLEEVLNENKNPTEALVVGFEFARRSSPAILFLERLDVLAPAATDRSAVIREEIRRTTWDENEVLVVAANTNLHATDQLILTEFDRVYLIDIASREDRVRLFERILRGRKEFDPSVLADITQDWDFESAKSLAVSLRLTEVEQSEVGSRDALEQLVERSGVIPLGNPATLRRIARRIEGPSYAKTSQIEPQYPDDFLDQLYLMSVGEDYAGTQRVIEILNDGMPLSSEEANFLGRHPHLLSGTPEDRLTRLLRAKKTNDRLQKIMGK